MRSLLAALCAVMAVQPVSTRASAAADPEAVVRADVRALNEGDAASLLALFSRDARIFRVPDDADRLIGPLSNKMGTHEQRRTFFTEMLSARPLSRVELLDTAVAGDLVAAKIRFSNPPDFAKSSYSLAIYRVHEGLIQDLWHLLQADEDPSAASREAEDVIRRFVSANNRGDVKAFLALFGSQARNFRNSGDVHSLGDRPSVRIVDEKSRRDAYEALFAKGAPAQVETVATVALGPLIVARDVATLPTGKVVDELSVYRVEEGLIQRDWFIFEQARPTSNPIADVAYRTASSSNFAAACAPSVLMVAATAFARVRTSGARTVLSAADNDAVVGVGPSCAAPIPN